MREMDGRIGSAISYFEGCAQYQDVGRGYPSKSMPALQQLWSREESVDGAKLVKEV